MIRISKRKHIFHLIVLLTLSTTAAYRDSICEENNTGIFCTCDTKYSTGETAIVCYITDPLGVQNEIWQSLAKVEKMSNLKLNSFSTAKKLHFVPTDSLQQMESLRYFTVEQASLGHINTSTFSNLRELRELTLEDDGITQLGEGAFSDLPKLKKLALSSNLLQELLVDSFKGVDELEHLYLDRNNISRIEGCAFCNLQNLRDLELYDNSLTDLTDYMFRGLRYLKRLDLYKNKISILNDRVFQNLPKLVELELNDNRISHVAPRAFQGLLNLQKILLTSNRIKTLPDTVFKSLPTLRNVDLINNELETLQEEVLQNMDNAKDEHFALSLKDNPIKCDCRLRWVKAYLHLNKSHQFSRELRELRCRNDGDNQTLHIVHQLKLDCNATEDLGSKNIEDNESRTITDHESRTNTDHVSRTSKDRKSKPTKDSDSEPTTDPEARTAHVPAAISFEKSSTSSGSYNKKNKTRIGSVVEVTEVQDSEAMDEDFGSSSVKDNGRQGSPSGSEILLGDARLVLLMTFVSYFLVRKRKGTML